MRVNEEGKNLEKSCFTSDPVNLRYGLIAWPSFILIGTIKLTKLDNRPHLQNKLM